MSFIKKSNAAVFLLINAVLWGSSYVWSKMLLKYLPCFSTLFIISFGGFISTGIIFFKSIKTLKLRSITRSMLISTLSILSNTFCIFALQYTGSSNTAFIVQTSVVITPLIMALAEKKRPNTKTIFSALVSLFGVFLITCDFSSFRLNIGDLLALCNALFFSLFLTVQNLNAKKLDTVHFTLVHQLTNTVVFFALAALLEAKYINFNNLNSIQFIWLILISILISVATILIQSSAIKYIRAENAILIYTFEPVTALWIAFLIMGEKLKGIESIIGCVVILLSVLYTTVKLPGRVLTKIILKIESKIQREIERKIQREIERKIGKQIKIEPKRGIERNIGIDNQMQNEIKKGVWKNIPGN